MTYKSEEACRMNLPEQCVILCASIYNFLQERMRCKGVPRANDLYHLVAFGHVSTAVTWCSCLL